MLGRGIQLKTTALLVSKIFESLASNTLADHLEKYVLFSDLRYGFWSDQLQIFLQLYLIEYMELDISKAFYKVWHAGHSHRGKFYEISVWIFGLVSSFFSNRWLRVILDWNSTLEYSVNVTVPWGSILGPKLFLIYTIIFLKMLPIMLSMLTVLHSTLL